MLTLNTTNLVDALHVPERDKGTVSTVTTAPVHMVAVSSMQNFDAELAKVIIDEGVFPEFQKRFKDIADNILMDACHSTGTMEFSAYKTGDLTKSQYVRVCFYDSDFDMQHQTCSHRFALTVFLNKENNRALVQAYDNLAVHRSEYTSSGATVLDLT